MRKSPFIFGFKQPTLSKNSYMMLSDIRGDGEGKLVIWSQQQHSIIIYKGSNRQIQKSVKLKHVNGIIQYWDQADNNKPVLGLSAQNGFYIFRGLAQSFRLKVPDIIAQPQQQIIWSQFENQPDKLAQQLIQINPKLLSESGKYFIGASNQRRKQIIHKVFSEGINQKDSISAMGVIRQIDNSVGNIILGTELRKLYILDSYGHSIIKYKMVAAVPSFIFAYGNYQSRFIIISVGRQGIIQLLGKADEQPYQTIKLNNRVVSCILSYPQLFIATSDQTIRFYVLTNSNFKLAVNKRNLKLNQQPIKIQLIKNKNNKSLVVAFNHQFRVYYQHQLIYTHKTDFKLYNIIYGSFARQEGCLVLLYEQNGFQVFILNRTFNIKQKYNSNAVINQTYQAIPLPKKSNHFVEFWKHTVEDNESYKLYQRNIRLLKWRTLKQRLNDKTNIQGKIQINSKILGIGPIFIIKLLVQNIAENPIYEINVIMTYQEQNIQIIKGIDSIKMLAPFISYQKEIQIKSFSKKNENITVQLCWQNNIVSTIVCIPNCQDVGQ